MINLKKQAGGTVLGIVIGLIVGLGIAVAVAVAITKTSLPFTNKMGKQDRAVDPSQPIDPNKPLYGNKDVTREAAKDFVKPAEPENTVADPVKPPVIDKSEKTKTAEKAVKPDNKTADSKTTDNKDKDAAKNDVAKAESAEEKWTYFLQAGAFREQGDAENTKAKLALQGFEASISERQTDNGILYRVRIGPFGQMEPMNRARSKLSDGGVDVAVVRQPKTK